MRCLIPSIVAQEIESSIKRYLLDHPEYLPEDEEIEDEDDFVVLLADYFDAMSGVSGGAWTTGYLASKGGNGAAQKLLSNSRIRREYGSIESGEAKGLEVFFMEFGEDIYPGGIPQVNVTPPAQQVDLVGGLTNLTALPALTAQALTNAPAFLPGIEIPGVNAPFYPVEGLEEALDRFYGDVKLSEVSTYYVMHAYDLRRRQNVYFVNDERDRRSVTFTSHVVTRDRPREVPTENDQTNEDFEYTPDNNRTDGLDFYLKDIVRGSSALPGFHEAKDVTDVDGDRTYTLVDGALVTNNPALQTLIFLSTEPKSIPIKDIAMISLGSGIAVNDIEQNVNASAFGWLLNNALVTVMADGSAENVQSQVDFLFYGNPDVQPNQYIRVQTTEPANSTEGDALTRVTEPNDLPVFKDIGEEVAKRYRKAIDQFVADFIFAEEE